MRTTLLFSLLSFIGVYTVCLGQSDWSQVGHAQVTEIDALGEQIWVGSTNGLFIIDKVTGEEQRLHPWNSPLKGSTIREIEISDQGDIWLSLMNGPLTRVRNGEWEYFTHLNGLLNTARNLKTAKNGDLWFRLYAIDNYICRLDTSGVIHHVTDQYPGISNYTAKSEDEMYVINDNQVFIYKDGNLGQGLLIPLEQDEFISDLGTTDQGELFCLTSQWSSLPSEKTTRIRKLSVDGNWELIHRVTDEQIQLISSSGPGIWFVQSIKNSKFKYVHLQNDLLTSYEGADLSGLDPLNNGRDYSLKYVDKDGDWWMHGLMDSDKPKVFQYNQGLISSYISLKEDPINEGFPKIANGCNREVYGLNDFYIDKYEDGQWSQIPYARRSCDCLRALAVNPMTCELWFSVHSADANFLVSYDGVQFEEMNLGEISPNVMTFDNQGQLYVGSWTSGLGIYDGQDWEWITEPFTNLSFPDHPSAINNLLVTENGEIFTSTHNAGVVQYNGTDWIQHNPTNSIVLERTNFVYEDLDGNVWTGHDEGILKYDGQQWELIVLPDLGPWDVFDMEHFQNGFYWISTKGNGFYSWDGGTTFTLNSVLTTDIGSNYITDIHEGPLGRFWFTHIYATSIFEGTILSAIDSEIRPKDLKFFPNPTAHEFRIIQPKDDITIHSLQIYTLTGRQILSIDNPDLTQTFSIDDSGTYLVELETSQGKQVQKLVVQR